jgi:hypothetical protein
VALQQIDGKKIRPARIPGSAVIRHGADRSRQMILRYDASRWR